jgi:hypothetical protein
VVRAHGQLAHSMCTEYNTHCIRKLQSGHLPVASNKEIFMNEWVALHKSCEKQASSTICAYILVHTTLVHSTSQPSTDERIGRNGTNPQCTPSTSPVAESEEAHTPDGSVAVCRAQVG